MNASASRWRLVQVLSAIFLLLMTYDGAVRKWLFPSAEQLVFVLKDIVLLLACIIAIVYGIVRQGTFLVPLPVQLCLAMYAAWVVIEALNPSLPSLLLALWGIKAHLLYIGLIILLPACARSVSDIFRVLVRLYPWVVIPVSVIALLQVAAPPDSVLNQTITEGDELARFGEQELVRVFGPFSYLSGMAAFVNFVVLLGAGLLLIGYHRRWALILGFAMAVLNLPSTGSRAVILTCVLGWFAMLIGGVMSREIGLRQVFVALVLIPSALALSIWWQGDVWQALAQRFEGSRSDEDRIFTAALAAVEKMSVSGVLGYGTGATNLAARAFVPENFPYWLPVGFEEESGRIVLELGVIGWVSSIAVRLSILFWCVYLMMMGNGPILRSTGIIALPAVLIGLYTGTGVFAATYGAVMYWFFVALLAMAQYEHVAIGRSRNGVPRSPLSRPRNGVTQSESVP